MRVVGLWGGLVNAVASAWDRLVVTMTRGQRLRVTLVLCLSLWLVLIVSAVARAQGQASEVPPLAQWLLWAQGPGIGTLVGFLLSSLVEYTGEWYQRLESKWKRLVFMALCMGVPLFFAVVAATFGYQSWSIEATFWPAMYRGGSMAFTAGTLLATKWIGVDRTTGPVIHEGMG